MRLFIVLVCLLMGNVLANTEAFYFRIPSDYTETKESSYQQISIDQITDIKFEVPSPNSQGHSKTWLEITGGVPGGFHNARFSWSALVRIDKLSLLFIYTNIYRIL